tara:strand:+ start:8128 stop:9561 length:1434 start_codon:yes stop_codon:yes gene_type:complete
MALRVAVVLAVLFWLWNKKKQAENRDPESEHAAERWAGRHDQRIEAAEQFRRRDEMSEEFADADPAFLVTQLRDGDWSESGAAQDALEDMGAGAASVLREALSDPTYSANVSGDAFEEDEIPLNKLLDVARTLADPNLLDALLPHLQDERESIRISAILAIGTIGTEATWAPLRAAMGDETLCAYAWMGLREGLETHGPRPGAAKALFDTAAALLWTDHDDLNEAVACMLLLDRDRALALVLDPDRWIPDRIGLLQVLRELAEAKVRVDANQILNLIERLEDTDLEYPNRSMLTELIELLALHADDAHAPVFERLAGSPCTEVREAVAEIRGRAAGVRFGDVVSHQSVVGWNQLSPVQKQIVAVWEYDMEVNNGGHSQYFFNSYGAHWRDALQGLEAIGATHDLELLRAAVAAFEDPPSEDTDERTNHLIVVLEDADEEIRSLDDQYYEDPQTRQVLWVDFALRHPEAFRDLQQQDD